MSCLHFSSLIDNNHQSCDFLAAPKTDQVTKPVPSNHPESSDAPKTGEPSVPSSTDDEKDDDDDAYADVPSSKVNDGWDDQEWGDLEVSSRTISGSSE